LLKRNKKNEYKNNLVNGGNLNNSDLFKTPIDINEILSEVISMIGVLSVDILDWNGKVLYSYYRWGKSDNILEEKELFSLIKGIRKQLNKINQGNLKHIIIRSDDLNIVVYSSEKITLIIHCDLKIKLALLTIRAQRATKVISDLL